MGAKNPVSPTWDAHDRNTTDRGPRETTLFALDRFVKERGTTPPRGKTKHWHVFHVVVKKH